MYFKYVFQLLVFQLLHNTVCRYMGEKKVAPLYMNLYSSTFDDIFA